MKLSVAALAYLLGMAVVSGASVKIVPRNGAYVLLRDDTPFYVQGAVAPNRFAELHACGANAVRTSATRSSLDAAHAAGLAVLANLPVRAERNGMDWSDDAKVRQQRDQVLAIVRKFKDHPAVLVWSLGNELDYIPGNRPYNASLWRRLNDIARSIKQIDPDHPVLTVVGTSRFERKIQEIARDAPDFDLLGLNAYGDLAEACALVRQYWPKPYLVSEWGPTGSWEVQKTAWGAPLEQTSSEKAAVIEQRYRDVILADRTHCVGSFVFYWSEKQETTHTWYGLFCQGLRTESIDVMEHFWRGAWPVNRAPALKAIGIEGGGEPTTLTLESGRRYHAYVQAADPDGDRLTFSWDIRPEVEIPPDSYAGSGERTSEVLPLVGSDLDSAKPTFAAPSQAGHYRLFVTFTDHRGSIGYGNVPFRVAAPRSTLRTP